LYKFIIYFELQKIRTIKLQTTTTFDREFGLRRSKNENCSKWRNKARGQSHTIYNQHTVTFYKTNKISFNF